MPPANVPPPLTVPPLLGEALTLMVKPLVFWVKLATKVLVDVRLNVKLADVLTTAPFCVQLVKVYPLLGDAVTVTLLPPANVPPPETVPAVFGEAFTVRE